jgi:NAD(P)-dependent dehydrogenase (short-subunit alcohol dehydrogenase family)
MTTTLITGANKGLGFETARRLIAAGHTVYVGSRDAERGRRAAERLGARSVLLDVTDDASVAAAAKTIEADGGLDVLVNNAGIEGRSENGGVIGAAEVTADVMRTVFETNVFGIVRVTHAFLPLLRRSAAPVVVNVSSGLASLTRVTTPDTLTYAFPGVREGLPGHPDQRRRARLHRDRPQPAHRHPDRRGRRRDHRPHGAGRPRRPDRRLRRCRGHPPLVVPGDLVRGR